MLRRANCTPTMTYTTLDWQIDQRVLTLTLNRPAQLNAFTTTMADELIDAYTRASADDAVGAVVVTGGTVFAVMACTVAAGRGAAFEVLYDPARLAALGR